MLVFHQSLLIFRDVFGSPVLFLQGFGGINLLRLWDREGFLDGRGDAPEQEAGRHDADNKNENSFGIFHDTHSIEWNEQCGNVNFMNKRSPYAQRT